MKYKAVMVMDGGNPVYEGNTIEEALRKAQDDCWVREDIHEGWVFAEPEEDWKKYLFSNFYVYNDNKEVVMCVWNPVLVVPYEEEY